MTTQSLGKIGRHALLISPVVIAVVSFFAVLHWLKPRNSTFVLVLSAVFAIFVIGYTSFITRRMQRTLDEVQIASQGFASFRGYVWGACTTVLLLMLPPVTNCLIDLADVMASGAPDMTTRHRVAVLLGLNFGLMLVVLMQMVCMIVASAIWQRRMGGMPEQS
jgi:membrane protein YdbS with pleckstrin-like domain